MIESLHQDTRIIQWKDPHNLSEGFIVDLEQCSVKQLIQTVYKNPEQLISAFCDCFLLMNFSPVESERMAMGLYNQTRSQVTNLLQHYIDTPFVQIPNTTTAPYH